MPPATSITASVNAIIAEANRRFEQGWYAIPDWCSPQDRLFYAISDIELSRPFPPGGEPWYIGGRRSFYVDPAWRDALVTAAGRKKMRVYFNYEDGPENLWICRYADTLPEASADSPEIPWSGRRAAPGAMYDRFMGKPITTDRVRAGAGRVVESGKAGAALRHYLGDL